MLAFVCGVAVSIPFMSSVLYTGPLARFYLGGADISYFISMLVSGAVYVAANRWVPARVGAVRVKGKKT
jgi:NCS1 family nucleobase:cation symporter-1